MSSKRKYSVTVTPDQEGEKFSPSVCNCRVCKDMHVAQIEWDTFTPDTGLQKRMKEIIEKLEKEGIDKSRRVPKFS
jgi:hypothetical protein